jgi:hypothetical protein
MTSVARKIELLGKLNPTVVTQSVADDAKWLIESARILASYALVHPGATSDKRVGELVGVLLETDLG